MMVLTFYLCVLDVMLSHVMDCSIVQIYNFIGTGKLKKKAMICSITICTCGLEKKKKKKLPTICMPLSEMLSP